MRSMTVAAQSTEHPDATTTELGRLMRVGIFIATMLVIIALAVLPLLTPLFIHPALDAAGAAARLGVEPAAAHMMSDASVRELVLGPGSFSFAGPDGTAFYDEAERGHLRDARILLWLFLGAGLISAVLIALALTRSSAVARASIWSTIAGAGAVTGITVVVLGVVSLVAFSTLFTLFHQVFFPGGNWAFDPTTQRLVQLYPFGFWQIAAGALGVLVMILAGMTWLLGRSMARRTRRAAKA
jgi:integral membrane protein (TIGR01906 family)